MTKKVKRLETARTRGGTYALVLFLEKRTTIRVGALGRFDFPRGYYIYVGSAMNGLDARIRRHLRPSKLLFWHVDYFLKNARIVDVWTRPGPRRLECSWARRVLALENARVVAMGLGASDCSCPSHLIHLSRRLQPNSRLAKSARLC